jgi:hypothetical protein
MLGRQVGALCCGAFGLLLADTASGEEQPAPKPARCISMGSVQTTTIVDDDRILFYQRGGRIYLNALDRTCVGLTRSGKFSYKVQSGARYVRMCDTDRINVLERTGNGFNCGLGMFVPVSAEAAAELLATGTTEQEQAVETQPVDLTKREPLAEPKNE